MNEDTKNFYKKVYLLEGIEFDVRQGVIEFQLRSVFMNNHKILDWDEGGISEDTLFGLGYVEKIDYKTYRFTQKFIDEVINDDNI